MDSKLDKRFGEIIPHKASGFNLDEVAQELSIKNENIVKAILLEAKDVEPILCIIRSTDKLDNKIVKKLYSKNFSFMKEDHLSERNLSTGAIPPFIGFQLNIKTYIDTKLDIDDFYYGSGGSVFNACKFLVSNYLILGAEITKLSLD